MVHIESLNNLQERIANAVAHYWKTRSAQGSKQKNGGRADQGLRGAVTGGAQMNGFIELFTEVIIKAGIPEQFIFRKKSCRVARVFQAY